MLEAIRERVTGIFAAVIVGALIVPFALWGVQSYFTGDTSTLVAEGDGVAITKGSYRNALDNYRRASASPQQFDNILYKRQVVEQMVNQMLAATDAYESGFAVGSQSMASYIRSQPEFQRDNQFDTELYKTALNAQRVSVAQFESNIRTDLMNRQIAMAYSDSAIVTADNVNRIIALGLQERVFEYTEINVGKFDKSVTVSRKEIEDYYKSRESLYQTEEKVKVEYLVLSAEELVKDYQPTAKELRQYYEEGAAALSTPEKRKVSHIMIESPRGTPKEEAEKALALIKDIKNKLDKGASFASLARKYSQDPGSKDKGGDLGELTPGMMVKEFEQAAQQLEKKGQVSSPVKTQFGYHLIKLTALVPAKRKPFSQVKVRLAKQLKQLEGEKRFYDLTESFYNTTYENPDSLEPAAEQLGLKLKKSGWVGRRGNRGLLANPRVTSAAFSAEVLEQGKNSDVIEINDTTMLCLRVVKHEPSKTKPLKLVERNIRKALEREKALNKASVLQKELLDRLNNGATLRSLAGRHGLVVKKKTLTREQGKGLDPSLLQAVFSAKRPEPGKITHGFAARGQRGVTLFSLKKVVDGNPEKASRAMREKVQALLRKRRGTGYYVNYRLGLRQNADIKIHDQNL